MLLSFTSDVQSFGEKFEYTPYSYCKKIGFRKVKPRPVHIKNDPKIMQKWQENFFHIIKAVKNKNSSKKFSFYYQDEIRYGQKRITTGVWSPKGIRPEYKNQNGFLNAWIYGAINTETGQRLGLVLPNLNCKNMQIFLKSFSRTIKRNEHILLILVSSKTLDSIKLLFLKI